MDDPVRKGELAFSAPRRHTLRRGQALDGKNVKDMLLNVGSGGGAAAAPVTAGGAAGGSADAPAEEKKEEKEEEKEESDEDMGFGLFD